MNEPMNLEDLPEYLKNANNNNIVVDMGMIVQKPRWPKRLAIASIFCLLVAGGIFAFNTTEEIAIVVNSNLGSDIVSATIRESGGEVIEVENNTYKVRISRFKNVSYFLEKLKSNKEIESVDLENK